MINLYSSCGHTPSTNQTTRLDDTGGYDQQPCSAWSDKYPIKFTQAWSCVFWEQATDRLCSSTTSEICRLTQAMQPNWLQLLWFTHISNTWSTSIRVIKPVINQSTHITLLYLNQIITVVITLQIQGQHHIKYAFPAKTFSYRDEVEYMILKRTCIIWWLAWYRFPSNLSVSLLNASNQASHTRSILPDILCKSVTQAFYSFQMLLDLKETKEIWNNLLMPWYRLAELALYDYAQHEVNLSHLCPLLDEKVLNYSLQASPCEKIINGWHGDERVWFWELKTWIVYFFRNHCMWGV